MKIVLQVDSYSPTESDKNISKLPGNFRGARWSDDIITGLGNILTNNFWSFQKQVIKYKI